MAFGIKSVLNAAAFAGVNEFLSMVNPHGGYAKPNRFEIIITPPTGVKGTTPRDSSNPYVAIFQQLSGSRTARTTNMMCESFSFPGKNLVSSPDTNMYGAEKEVVTGETFGDITSTFYLSSDLREKRYFNAWQAIATASEAGGFTLGYYDDYVGRIQISQLDEKDNKTYSCTLIDCFPKTVSDLAVNQAIASDIQKLTVTWTYRYWKSDEDEAGKPFGLRIADAIKNTVTRRLTAQIPSVLRRL